MAETVEELKRQLAEAHQRYADVTGEGSSFRKLQVDLDAALQKHKDKEQAHAIEILGLKAEHKDVLDRLDAQHGIEVMTLRDQHAAALELQAKAISEKYAADIAELKRKHILPIVQAEHARQAAALQAQQAAQVAELQ